MRRMLIVAGAIVASARVAGAQLCRSANREVVDALLWLEPFVDVLVAGKHHLHAILDE